MTALTIAILPKHKADREPDGYRTGWFKGDLADDLPTQTFPSVREKALRQQWAEPTPELLRRVLDALQNL